MYQLKDQPQSEIKPIEAISAYSDADSHHKQEAANISPNNRKEQEQPYIFFVPLDCR